MQEISEVVDSGRPFRLSTADGTEYYVRHRDYLARAPYGKSVLFYEDNGRFHLIALSMIVSISAVDPAMANPESSRGAA